jgi:hypothetical protein
MGLVAAEAAPPRLPCDRYRLDCRLAATSGASRLGRQPTVVMVDDLMKGGRWLGR